MQEHKYEQVYMLWTRELQALVIRGMLQAGASKALLLSAAAQSNSGWWWAPRRVQSPHPPLWVRLSLYNHTAIKEMPDSEKERTALSSHLSTTCSSLGSAFTNCCWLKQVKKQAWMHPEASEAKLPLSSRSLGLAHGSQLLQCSTQPPAQKLLWCPAAEEECGELHHCTSSSVTRAPEQGSPATAGLPAYVHHTGYFCV